MSQRRGELPDSRDAPGAGEIVPQSLRLQFRLLARQAVGEHLPKQPEALHELVPPRALGPKGAERERPHDPIPDHQRDLDVRLDAQGEVGPQVHRGFLSRKLFEPGEANCHPTLQPRRGPGNLIERDRRWRLGYPIGFP